MLAVGASHSFSWKIFFKFWFMDSIVLLPTCPSLPITSSLSNVPSLDNLSNDAFFSPFSLVDFNRTSVYSCHLSWVDMNATVTSN
jgi:hypothetical protein